MTALTAGNGRNGTGVQSPTLMTNTAGTYQYGVCIRADWGVTVFRRNLSTNVYTTYDLSANATASVGLNLPIITTDDHYGVAIGVDDQERVWIAGNSHSSPLKLIRSAAADITSWTNLSLTYPPTGWPTSGGTSATGSNDHTYHHFDRFGGELYWWVDQEETAFSSRGRDFLGFRLPAGTSSWSPLVGQGEFATSEADKPQGVTADRVYVHGTFVETLAGGSQRLHIWGIWRLFDIMPGGYPSIKNDGSTDPPSQMLPWYLYSDTPTVSTSWKRANGGNQPMPLTWTNSGARTTSGATISSAPGTYQRSLAGNLAIDSAGHPHVILRYEDTAKWFRCWWDGNAWQSVQVTGTSFDPCVFSSRQYDFMYAKQAGRLYVYPNGGVAPTTSFSMGGPVDSVFYSPRPDPIQQSRGELHLMIPDGDNPKVYTFGGHARRVAV